MITFNYEQFFTNLLLFMPGLPIILIFICGFSIIFSIGFQGLILAETINFPEDTIKDDFPKINLITKGILLISLECLLLYGG